MAAYECIAGTEMESDDVAETMYDKHLDTLWYVKANIPYEHMGKFGIMSAYIFPTEYQTAPKAVESIVAVDLGGRYLISLGKVHNIELGTAEFQCTLRFTNDGHMNFSIFEANSNTSIIKDEIDLDPHESKYTPRHFGKTFKTKDDTDIEIYPIKENIEGLCDCVIKNGDELFLSNGMETGIMEYPLSLVINEDKGLFQIVKDD